MDGFKKILGLIVYNGAFLLLLCLTTGQSAFGQESFKGSLSAGITTSQVSGDNLSGFNKLGFIGSVGARIQVADKWTACMDIAFIQKGSRKVAKPDKGDFESYLMALNYAQVPVYVIYTQDKWEFELGLYTGYLLNAKEEDQNGTILRPGREYKDLDIGGLAGLYYPIGERVKLNIRVSNSLLPIREHAGGSTFRLNQGQYNSVLSFSLRFDLGQ